MANATCHFVVWCINTV